MAVKKRRTVGERKRRRILMLALGAVALVGSATIIGFSFTDAFAFYTDPSVLVSDANAGKLKPTKRLRLGGMVVEGSLSRGVDNQVRFEVTDFEEVVAVRYQGLLPDLFSEGQGMVAEGYYRDGVFTADTILAKHDESYMPREVEKALEGKGGGMGGGKGGGMGGGKPAGQPGS
ncbi:MAG: cytochrome c maturation protein CcmE [Neomegalonema sp.]|nr:cytochrome c maturation protein CcmE [Neomegalonema sp.]